MSIISVKNLTKIYKDYQGNINKVLDNLNFDIEENKITVIMGKSGCGKTTLLNVLASIDSNVDNGQIIINNKDILKLNEKQKAVFRNNNIGFIFQSHELIPEFNVLENAIIPLLLRNESRTKAEKIAKVELKELGIHEKDFYKKPYELSGGQQQRVAIVRAIIHKPKIIFADEPTGNLDTKTRDSVMQLILTLKSKDRAIVIVTHDNSIKTQGDEVFVFEENKDKFVFKKDK